MIRTLLITSAIAMTAPALAQQATGPDAAATPQSAIPTDPQASTPDTSATPARPANAAASVAIIVDSEFPAYDANGDGQLDQAEFGRWMVALKDQEMKATGKTLPPDQVTTWASGAFTTADADKSHSVSKPELITYLSGGAA